MDPEEDLRAKYKVAVMVWISMVAALFFYGVIAQLSFSYVGPHSADIGLLWKILAIVSIFELVIANVVKNFILNQKCLDSGEPERRMRINRLFTASIASLACCEAIALYGFILALLSGKILYYIPFALGAFGGLFFYRPQLEFWRKHVEQSAQNSV